MEIGVVVDNICDVKTDVIVNSTNGQLQLDNGSISKSILKAAGPQLQAECSNKYPKGISESTVAITKGYNLKCNNVFHLALPALQKYNPDLTLKNLTEIMTKCLQEADQLGAKSIAFPVLGAGGLKYPIEKLPSTMYEAARKYFKENNTSQLKDVKFVIYPNDTKIIEVFDTYFLAIESRIIRPVSKATPTRLPTSKPHQPPSLNGASTIKPEMEIGVVVDNICDVKTDVIVNSTNGQLQLDNGSISKSILKAAGPQLQAECSNKYPKGISESTVAITKGYNLKCNNVFHLALPALQKYNPDLTLKNLTEIMTKCLQEADKLSAKSIAFPVLGAGGLKYPIEKLPPTMYEAARKYFEENNTSRLKGVKFVIYPNDTKIIEEFKKFLKDKREKRAEVSKGSNQISNISNSNEDNSV
ncbi:hypothetical protein Ahia01_000188800, partial [Argonauta hians]